MIILAAIFATPFVFGEPICRKTETTTEIDGLFKYHDAESDKTFKAAVCCPDYRIIVQPGTPDKIVAVLLNMINENTTPLCTNADDVA